MPLPPVPDWLAKREGTLRPGLNARVALVHIAGQLLYKLEALPAGGAYTCAVTQTVNGRRLDDGTTYPSVEAALTGGLEQLRNKLGW